MKTKIIEATQGVGGPNHGKFLIAHLDMEWERKSAATGPGRPLLARIGWAPGHIIVFDLQTCEGAAFRPGGIPSADIEKHRIWVCPLFEPLLKWLYEQDLSDLDRLPDSVELRGAPFALRGYRRSGAGTGAPATRGGAGAPRSRTGGGAART